MERNYLVLSRPQICPHLANITQFNYTKDARTQITSFISYIVFKSFSCSKIGPEVPRLSIDSQMSTGGVSAGRQAALIAASERLAVSRQSVKLKRHSAATGLGSLPGFMRMDSDEMKNVTTEEEMRAVLHEQWIIIQRQNLVMDLAQTVLNEMETQKAVQMLVDATYKVLDCDRVSLRKI